MTFRELAALIGSLPRQADQPSFWEGSRAQHNWQPYGFRARLASGGDAVIFSRPRPVMYVPLRLPRSRIKYSAPCLMISA